MKKILVLFTGGTIGSITTDGIIDVEREGKYAVVEASALLGMYFRHFNIPLFIIASNKPIGEKGSNGLFNFTSAVGLIKEGKYKGVFTLYERVMLPTRVIPADTCRDRFGVYGYDGF